MSHTSRMARSRPLGDSRALVCHYGRGPVASSGGRVCRDSSRPVNVGERKTMAKVQIDARTLARVYDMAKDSHERTKEAIEEEDLPGGAMAQMEYMASQQEGSLEIVEEILENDPHVTVGDR